MGATADGCDNRLQGAATVSPQDGDRAVRILLTALQFLIDVHGNLLRTVRNAGFRRLAMPTLCTGGVGMPVEFVAIAVLTTLQRDFFEHPSDPMRVRIACFEDDHVGVFQTVKAEMLQ